MKNSNSGKKKNQSELKIGVADKWDPPIRGTVDEILDKHYLSPFSLFSVLIPGKRKPQKKNILARFWFVRCTKIFSTPFYVYPLQPSLDQSSCCFRKWWKKRANIIDEFLKLDFRWHAFRFELLASTIIILMFQLIELFYNLNKHLFVILFNY